MFWKSFKFCYISKVCTIIFLKITTIRIDRICGDFTKSNTGATYTFKCKSKATNTSKKIYKSKISHEIILMYQSQILQED